MYKPFFTSEFNPFKLPSLKSSFNYFWFSKRSLHFSQFFFIIFSTNSPYIDSSLTLVYCKLYVHTFLRQQRDAANLDIFGY